MPPSRSANGRPRSVVGGRSPRYDERRAARAPTSACAPVWSDAAAKAVMEVLQSNGSRKTTATALNVLTDSGALNDLLGQIRVSLVTYDVALVREIVDYHASIMQDVLGTGDSSKISAKVKAFLKPLYDRRVARGGTAALAIDPAAKAGPTSFHAWLSETPPKRD